MKHLCTCAFVLASAVAARAADPGLPEARRCWLRGDYESARKLYEGLCKNPAARDAASVGLSRVWTSLGQYDRALDVIDSAVAVSKSNPDLHARRAELLYLRGRWEDADRAAGTALAQSADHFLARWVRAQIHRDRGDLKQADADFRWFVRAYTAHNDTDQEIKDPDDLLLIGLAACENARWNCLPDQFQFVLNEVFGDAVKYEKEFWLADCQTGMVYLEKYNRPDAMAAFDRALATNPNAAEALVGRGLLAFQHYEYQEADRFAEKALKTNPNLPQALALVADVYLASGQIAKAQHALARAQQVNPRDEEVLGRIAFCHFLQHRDAEFRQVVHEVESRDAKPGLFFLVLAEHLDVRLRYHDAEAFYKRAAEYRPMLGAAPSALGLLYMRMGREQEARPLLDKAFAADNFNVRVSNMLTVLDHLGTYETVKTQHFVLRYDPKSDKYLARYLTQCLESAYAQLSSRFHYELRAPVSIEVFNSHEMFSGRVTALPDLHTIGASTGRVVAMASPRAKGIGKPFNWARVVRHELVHVFNLEQTGFQVPHWLTEGLAVANEGFPRSREWAQVLTEHLQAGTLLNLDTIDPALVRPRSEAEWSLAYCQSQLYTEYLASRFGPDAVSSMLNAYGQGLDTRAAIKKCFTVAQEGLEEDYRAYVAEAARATPFHPSALSRSFPQLQEAYHKNPGDANTAARLSEQLLLRRRDAEAQKLAEDVLSRHPAHPLASYVKAQMLLNAGDNDQARAVLEPALAQGSGEPKVVGTLGKLYSQSKDYGRAAEMFELARKVEPYEPRWLSELVEIYRQAGDRDRQLAALRDLAQADSDDIDTRKRAARLLLEMSDAPGAEKFALQALEIDPPDPIAEELYGDALLGQRKWAEAIDAYEIVLELDSRRDAARIHMAQALLESGKKTRAAAELDRVLARDPENAEAQRLRARLDR